MWRKKIFIIMLVFVVLMGCGKKESGPLGKDIEIAYEKAYEAFSWFESSTMPTGLQTATYDGFQYTIVEHDIIANKNQLTEYLSNIFSPKIVNSLMEKFSPHYAEIDGQLYAIMSSQSLHPLQDSKNHEIIRKNDTQIIYKIEVELPDLNNSLKKETYKFIYELIGDKWLFSSFYFL